PTIYKELQVDNVEHPDTQKMIESIKNGDLDGIFASTGNVLESVTLEKNPQVKRIKDRMLAFGAEAALMSGSG
ncbi:4-(cytidine 5'-diphospho)-2-C-methyl-D-erythritol kinase, partial [Escherichia coli]|nr:4-(cytidine 5'-diphospho)-2-C-methyl-D-erythritol kinase [Escherichia coli]